MAMWNGDIYILYEIHFSKQFRNLENPLIIKWNHFILSSSLQNFNQRAPSEETFVRKYTTKKDLSSFLCATVFFVVGNKEHIYIAT